MQLTRREVGALGAGAVAAAAFSSIPMAAFAKEDADAVVQEFTGGAQVTEGGVTITAPEIAENGNTVPVSIDAPGAVAVLLIAPANPNSKVARFHFSEISGSQDASTRIRLAGTQEVTAIAKMADGSFASGRRQIKVTSGGCGG